MTRVISTNGEIHYAIDETELNDPLHSPKGVDVIQIRKKSKRDASKPLFLKRSE